jgi:hypothetical protein
MFFSVSVIPNKRDWNPFLSLELNILYDIRYLIPFTLVRKTSGFATQISQDLLIVLQIQKEINDLRQKGILNSMNICI